MNIGDKVRIIKGTEQGVITRFLQGGSIVEIEIEDGFKIPVQRSEVAVVAAAEAIFFKQGSENQKSTDIKPRAENTIIANNGIFLAFVPLNDREYAQYLINNTDWEIPFALYVGSEPHFRGLKSGMLSPRTSTKIQELLAKDFDDWGTFTFQALFLRPAFMFERQPFVKRLKCRGATFYKARQKAPLLGKEAHVFQLDADEPKAVVPTKIVPEQLTEKMMDTPLPATQVFEKPSAIIDLHIEKLSKDSLAMSNAQMLDLQLKTFEKHLEAAIASGSDEVTFIHGVGNGILRHEIHRRLSQHKFVKYFEDAQKEKFGFGATKAKIR